MASRDGLIKTDTKGVYYREHPTRRNGPRKDQQWVIRQTIGGKERKSTFGWASLARQRADDEHRLTYSVRSYGDAVNKVDEYRQNHKWNQANPDQPPRPVCLDDELASAEKLGQKVQAQREMAQRKDITFGSFFDESYLPQCKVDKKPKTSQTEELLFNHWIRPVTGELKFNQIGIDHLDKIKRNMLSGERPAAKKHPRDKTEAARNAQNKRNPARPMSSRSINYALAIIRQIWNRACSTNPPLAHGDWPGSVKSFRKPRIDNQRKRFLTRNEAARLMAALKAKSQDLHDIALLSLHCGLRAGEVFRLTWDRANIQKGELTLVDTKNGQSRIAYLTDATQAMLRQRAVDCQHQRFIFLAANGKPYSQVPSTFSRTVKDLGLNEGITDSRDKIVFHSLRHTYASWLVENGASLPVIRDLLGHKNLIMTSRYSHPSAEAQKHAIQSLNESMRPEGDNITHINARRKP